MMRTGSKIGTLAALCTLSAGLNSAPAADLPARVYTKAPVLAPAPYNWSGFYFGANAGFGLGRNSSEIVNIFGQSANAYVGPLGAIGGGQAGFNWQSGIWLLGLETDIQAADMRDDRLCGRFCQPGGYLRLDQRLNWFGTTRARLGLVTGPVLSYFTGGVAYGSVETTASVLDFNPGNFSFKETRTGWTWGSGVEASLGGNWTGKIEYLYLNLGNQSANFNNAGTGHSFSSEIREHIFRAGVNYRIGVNGSYVPSPVANWSGFYLGANAGAATARNQTSFYDTAAAPVWNETYNLMPNGYIAGVQGGYNWQSAAWVVGIEADIQGSTQRDNSNCMLACLLTVAQRMNVDQRMTWLGTVRGRLGYSFGPTLFYATGGLAYGGITNDVTEFAGPALVASFKHSKGGWTAGGGVETPLDLFGWLGKGWTTKTEYLYVDLGRITDTFTYIGFNQAITSRVTEHVFRSGINYRFNAPVVSKY
jgi:outer membrane immunogenic protein